MGACELQKQPQCADDQPNANFHLPLVKVRNYISQK